MHPIAIVQEQIAATGSCVHAMPGSDDELFDSKGNRVAKYTRGGNRTLHIRGCQIL